MAVGPQPEPRQGWNAGDPAGRGALRLRPPQEGLGHARLAGGGHRLLLPGVLRGGAGARGDHGDPAGGLGAARGGGAAGLGSAPGAGSR